MSAFVIMCGSDDLTGFGSEVNAHSKFGRACLLFTKTHNIMNISIVKMVLGLHCNLFWLCCRQYIDMQALFH